MNITIRNPGLLRWFGFYPANATVTPMVSLGVRTWALCLWWAVRYPRRQHRP